MTGEGDTDELISRLARDLEPVRVLPRLRWVVAGLFALAAVAVVAAVLWLGPRSDLLAWAGSLSGFSVLTGTLGLALGTTLIGLGLSVPGRDELQRAGIWLTGFAGITFLLGLLSAASAGPTMAWQGLGPCAVRAVSIGLLPALAAVVFTSRAYPQRSGLAFGLAAAGMAAAAAVGVHIVCPASAGAHIAAGHLLLPCLALAGLALIFQRFGGTATR